MKAQKEGSKAADKPDHAQLMREFELVRRNGRPEAEKKTADSIGNTAADAILSVRQRDSQHPLLQAVDYILWSIYRAYEKNEPRYYDFMKDKIKLVHDVFDPDGNEYYGTYYTSKNPFSRRHCERQ